MSEIVSTDEKKFDKRITLTCVNGLWTCKFKDSSESPITTRDLTRLKRVLLTGYRTFERERRLKYAIAVTEKKKKELETQKAKEQNHAI